MRDNEFDKDVKEKMEEFRLPPSAPVWLEVERRINERKKRRVLIFWFCLAGLLMAGLGGWWIWQNNDEVAIATTKDNVASVTTSTTDASTIATEEKNNISNGSATQKNADANTVNTPSAGVNLQQDKIVQPSTGSGTLVAAKSNTPEKGGIVSEDDHAQSTQLKTGKGKKSKRIPSPENNVNAPEADKDKPVVTQNNPAAVPDATAVPVSTDITPVPATASLTPVLTPIVTVPKSADTLQAVAAVEQKPDPVPRKKKKSNWQTGLVFAFGEARLTQGGLTLFSEKSFDALQSGVTTGNGGFSNQSFADSVPLKGLGIHTGFFAKRKLGKKTFFSAGFNLAYYSGKQRVGARVDSVRQLSAPFFTDTRDGFYQSGSASRYTNRYYYLQLPLLLHWQLNKGTKWPAIEWENGFVPSVLISSRALVYDPSGRIFFRDKSVYNKFSLVYQTGFTARFASRTKHPLTAGFYYNYHFSRLQKINPPDFNHQSSYGIQFRWLLKK